MPVPPEQLEELQSCFDLVASTSGGDFVTVDQLNALWQAAGYVMDDGRISALLGEVQLERPDRVHFKDFLEMLKKQAKASKEQEIEYAFLALTKGNRKVLDAATLKANLDEAKANFTDVECQRIVTLLGGSSSSGIDFEQFRAFMQQDR